MKLSRLYYILFIVMGSLFLASCDDDDNNSVSDNGVKVVAAQTAFEANGGTHDITVDKDIVKAYSADEWLSVSSQGTTVSITAGVNASMESRHTTIVIKASETDSTIVNVSQMGSVFSLEGLDGAIGVTSYAAASFTYAMQHALPVTVSASDDWIIPTVGDDNLKVDVTENTTGHMRRGWLAYSCGSIKDTVEVVQYNFKKDIAGEYYLAYLKQNNDVYAFQAELSQVGSSYQLALPELGLTLPVSFDTNTCKLSVTAGSYMGPYDNKGTTYYIYALLGSSTTGNLYIANTQMSAPFEYDDENGTIAEFDTSVCDFLSFYAFTDEEITEDGMAGALEYLFNPFLMKADDVAAAKKGIVVKKGIKFGK